MKGIAHVALGEDHFSRSITVDLCFLSDRHQIFDRRLWCKFLLDSSDDKSLVKNPLHRINRGDQFIHGSSRCFNDDTFVASNHSCGPSATGYETHLAKKVADARGDSNIFTDFNFYITFEYRIETIVVVMLREDHLTFFHKMYIAVQHQFSKLQRVNVFENGNPLLHHLQYFVHL